MKKNEISIFWFRRDLRLIDNAGLFEALKNNASVLPIFIFDTDILKKLPYEDKRVCFIYNTLVKLQTELLNVGSSLLVLHGNVMDVFDKLISNYSITSVYANHDYEPYAIERDTAIFELLKSKNILFKTFKDQVIFEKLEVTKDDGTPYTIFTPYSKVWKHRFNKQLITPYESENYLTNFYKTPAILFPTLKEIGFATLNFNVPSPDINEILIRQYHETRNLPSVNGTSKLSTHLRFGTVSIRNLVKYALELNELWLNELIWREFFMMILYNFPYVKTNSFKKKYDFIVWRNNEDEFKKWCTGNTGYPIVDAGMRELNETGLMHNRVRMVVASFLTKHLLIDWRWGEAYFAEKLLDFELSSNNGNWQWSAGSGCDSAPYFRIFNPYEQVKRFDPDLIYIKKWVKNFNELDYPAPIVEHKAARERVLKVYKAALENYTG